MNRLLAFAALALLLPGLARAQEDHAPERYQQSYAYEAAYRYDHALAQLDGIPVRDQDAYFVPLRRGWLLYLLGRYEESASAYHQAIEAQPEAIEARLGLTLPLMALRRWAETQAECRAVLRRSPGHYLAQSRLAYALYNAGQHGESARLYQDLVDQYPADVEMRAGLAWALLKQGEQGQARGHFESVLHLSPDHASATEGMALVR